MRPFCFSLLFLFASQSLQPFVPFNFVVWNVGQGSWSTYLEQDQCFHFDMGGEKLPFKEALSLCRNKRNWLLLSHEDWDHINGVKAFSRKAKHLCLFYPKKTRRSALKTLIRCPWLPRSIQLISRGNPSESSNDGSLVYLLKKKILISGDASMKEEKKWLKSLSRLQGLLLGHHGSHTSTSKKLLQKTKPHWAVASSRKRKYGHPHQRVQNKLKKQRVPLLKTETLGNIYFYVK